MESAGSNDRITSTGRSLGTAMTIKNQQKRSLETIHRSLDQERDHFLKLMTLNQKLLRSRQDKRKDRISRIRSHLTVPEITEIENSRSVTRQTNVHSVESDDSSLSDDDVRGATRPIESALSLSPRFPRTKSFYGHTSVNQKAATDRNEFNSSASLKTTRTARVNDGRKSISAPGSQENRKMSQSWDFADAGLNKTHPPTKSRLKTRERRSLAPTSGSTRHRDSDAKTTLSWPTTTTRQRTLSTSNLPSTLTFSCHEESKRENERRRSTSAIGSQKQQTITPGDVFDEAASALKREKVRTDLQNLMVAENELHAIQLQRRKDELMFGVQEMVNRDREAREGLPLPPNDNKRVPLTAMSHVELIESASRGVDIDDLRAEIRRRKAERMGNRMKMDVPVNELNRKEEETDDDYVKRLDGWWRDMRKVRYLRRNSTKQDLSDVVTLAVAQQKNQKLWRQSLGNNLF